MRIIEHGSVCSIGRKYCLMMLSNNIALVALNGMLKYWDFDVQRCTNKIEINITATCILNFLNKYIILGSDLGKICIYDCASFQLIRQINAHHANKSVNCIIFYDNDKFISCSHDNFIKIWSIASDNYLNVINNSYSSNCLILSKDNTRLISGGNSGNIRIWNVKNRAFIKNIYVNRSLWLFEITNDNKLICAEKSGLIKIWSLLDFKCEIVLRGHSRRIETLKLVNDNELVTCSLDGTLKHWNLNKEECLKSFNVSMTDCSKFF